MSVRMRRLSNHFHLCHRGLVSLVSRDTQRTSHMAKILGYCRVSTSEQADEGVSLAAQQQQITGYAMMKGWTVPRFFIERGVSGSVPLADRPEGKQLLAAASKGDVIITAKLD